MCNENKLKPGDQVKMNGNYYVNPEDRGKVWTVRSNPWNLCGTEVVLLEGRVGGYATGGLTLIKRGRV